MKRANPLSDAFSMRALIFATALVSVVMFCPQHATAETFPPAERADAVLALIAGTLSPGINPGSLFDCALTDETAIAAEKTRLALLISTAINGGQDASLRNTALAQLTFLSLPAETRSALLGLAKLSRPDAPVADEAATAAREADLLIANETARLQLFTLELAATERALDKRAAEIVAQAQSVLRWRGRIKKLGESTGAAPADALYTQIRVDLQAYRKALDDNLDTLESNRSIIPVQETDQLTLPADHPDYAAIQSVRITQRKSIAALRSREQEILQRESASLDATISSLNSMRLDLLSHVSPHLRSQVTGFTPAGRDQLKTEVWQLSLIVRRHAYLARTLAAEKSVLSFQHFWGLSVAATPLILCFILFMISRRFSSHALRHREHAVMRAGLARGETKPSAELQFIRFLLGILAPLERLVLFAALCWLAPAAAYNYPEVRLALVVTGWILSGHLAIHALNSAGALLGRKRRIPQGQETDGLRLRSLRLLGRYAIAVAVLMAATNELVGKGAIYEWVSRLGALALVIPAILLTRWWRTPVFESAERMAGRWRMARWVHERRESRLQTLIVALGGPVLFAIGAWTLLKKAAERFDLVHRGRAILLRRELSSRPEAVDFQPVPDALFQVLSPDCAQETFSDSPVNETLETIRTRVRSGGGGILAVIGARGMGKTSLFRALAAEFTGSLAVSGDALTPVTSPEQLFGKTHTLPALVLVDDAQRLFQPKPGGLKVFDALHAFARQHSAETVWVLAVDDICWPFLVRARDSQPLFDEVLPLPQWGAADLARLLLVRCQAAGIVPSFEHLLPGGVRFDDPETRAEEIASRRDGYFHMIWSHARGNPGIALEIWRQSLGVDGSGTTCVKPFISGRQQPFNAMQDKSLFTIRALLMMEPSDPVSLSEAMDIPLVEINAILQSGLQAGHMVHVDGQYGIDWAWRRTLLDLLERKHMLVTQ